MLHINHHHAVHAKSFIAAFRCSNFETEIQKNSKGVASALKIPTEGHEVKESLVFCVEISVLKISKLLLKLPAQCSSLSHSLRVDSA